METQTIKENNGKKEQPFMSVNAQVEGAFMAVFSVIIGLLALHPLLFLFSFVGPVPSILLVMRRGVKAGFLAALVAGCAFSILVGFGDGIAFVVNYSFVGLAMGLAIKRSYPPSRVILIGMVFLTIGTILVVSVAIAVMGIQLEPIIEEARTKNIELYEFLKFDEEQMEQVRDVIGKITLKSLIVPALTLILFGSLFYIFLVYITAQQILKRLGYIITPFPPFKTWRIPWYYSWLLIGAFLSLYLGKNEPGNIASVIGGCLFLSCTLIYTFSAISVAYFFLDKIDLPKFGKIILLLIITFFLGQIMMLVGLFDSWYDFRKLEKKKDEGENNKDKEEVKEESKY